jgi:MATE family multidrug resistance protein
MNDTMEITQVRRVARHWREELRILGMLCIPMIATQLAVISLSTTDVLMMGWLGKQQLAAGALGMQFQLPIFLLAMGIIQAVATLVAQAIGANDNKRLRHSLRQGFWVAVCATIPLSFLLWNGDHILLLLGQEPIKTGLAGGYLKANMWGFLAGLMFITMRGFLIAHSDIVPVLIISLVGVVLNIIGNYALMFGNFGFPRLELVGAGITSSIINWYMCISLLIYIIRHRVYRGYELFRRFWRSDWPLFFEIVRIGLPVGITILASTGFFSVATLMIGTLGTVPLAAHAIAQQIVVIIFMVPLAISQAASIRVALSVGAEDRHGVYRAGWTSIFFGMGIVLSICLFIALARVPLTMAFLDTSLATNTPVVELAAGLLIVAAIYQIFDGLVILTFGPLRGMKDTRVPMIISFIGYWVVGLSSCIIFGFVLDGGVMGIWIGITLGTVIVSALNTRRFIQKTAL